MKSVLKFTKFSTSLYKSIRTLTSSPNFNPEATVEESPIFLRSKFRRPPTITPARSALNSCRLIGTVTRPVTRLSLEYAYTCLRVKTSCLDSGWDSSFKILLDMYNHLAEISSKYLKPDDYIYVEGNLSSYTKVDESGKSEVLYKVRVNDLNYVRYPNTNNINHKIDSTNANLTERTSCDINDEKALSSDESESDARKRDRLLLWQVFFASPNEWWDNRHNKRYPKAPDFKHKDTKECLWLRADDPQWIKRQLQHYDSNARETAMYKDRSTVNKRGLDDFV